MDRERKIVGDMVNIVKAERRAGKKEKKRPPTHTGKA